MNIETAADDNAAGAADAIEETVGGSQIEPEKAVETLTHQQEVMMEQGKATLEKVAEKTRETVGRGMKAVDEVSVQTRGNMEAMAAMGRAAAQGFEALAQQAAEYSRRSFEETGAALRDMASAKSPNDLYQRQSQYAKAQFDSMVAEFSKLSETLIKVMGDVMEPLSNRMAVTTDKVRSGLKL